MIKLIAVDMDGTFLDSDKEYNRERFMKLYSRIKEHGIKFVVASGNQYYQLRSFFEEIRHEIGFAAENGSLVIDQNEEIYCAEIPKEDVTFIMEQLKKYDDIRYTLSGRKSAYLFRKDADLYDEAIKYYYRLEFIDSLDDIDDKIFKFALRLPAEIIPEVLAELNPAIAHVAKGQHVAYDAIDINPLGGNKAVGLTKLQEIYDIKPEEIMAFGDSGNDLEMLQHAGHGYAMENAAPEIKAATTLRAPHNDSEGVLEIIETYLDTKE